MPRTWLAWNQFINHLRQLKDQVRELLPPGAIVHGPGQQPIPGGQLSVLVRRRTPRPISAKTVADEPCASLDETTGVQGCSIDAVTSGLRGGNG